MSVPMVSSIQLGAVELISPANGRGVVEAEGLLGISEVRSSVVPVADADGARVLRGNLGAKVIRLTGVITGDASARWSSYQAVARVADAALRGPVTMKVTPTAGLPQLQADVRLAEPLDVVLDSTGGALVYSLALIAPAAVWEHATTLRTYTVTVSGGSATVTVPAAQNAGNTGAWATYEVTLAATDTTGFSISVTSTGSPTYKLDLGNGDFNAGDVLRVQTKPASRNIVLNGTGTYWEAMDYTQSDFVSLAPGVDSTVVLTGAPNGSTITVTFREAWV